MNIVETNKWTAWIKFNDLFEYHGLVRQKDEPGRDASSMRHKHLGKEGTLHTDDGFRLRSHYASMGSFPKETKISLDKIPCPLLRKMVGCYQIKITYKGNSWDYIGQCAETTDGMRKRLTQHFRKICDIPEHPYQKKLSPEKRFNKESARGMSYTDKKDMKFKELGKLFRENYDLDPSDPDKKFWDCVKIRFVHVDPEKSNFKKKIEKIEGLAIMAFIFENEHLPKLNSKNELVGMKNFNERLDGFVRKLEK